MTNFDYQANPYQANFLKRLVLECMDKGGKIENAAIEIKRGDITKDFAVCAAKIAKFVLGAANRMPESAKRYFEGHAIMVIGIAEDGSIKPAKYIDITSLADKVAEYVPSSVIWELEFVPDNSADGHGIMFVIVNPPQVGAKPVPCLRNSPLVHRRSNKSILTKDTIYTRKLGKTCKATDGDIAQLNRRWSGSGSHVFQLDLSIHMLAVTNEEQCISLLESYFDRFQGAIEQRVSNSTSCSLTRPNTLQIYKETAAGWRVKANEMKNLWANELEKLLMPGLLVDVQNHSSLYLKNVQFELNIQNADRSFLGIRPGDRPTQLDEIRRVLRLPPIETIGNAPSPDLEVNSATFTPDNTKYPHIELSKDRQSGILTIPEVPPLRKLCIYFPDHYFLSVKNLEKMPKISWSATADDRDYADYGEALIPEDGRDMSLDFTFALNSVYCELRKTD
ncbi:MAG: hypothetical protein Q3972_08055 [Corynebacterium sp.]|nr:hypothetical protein [Corynebacterium sp.]